FAWLLAAVLWRGWQAFVHSPRRLMLLGCGAGVVTLLVTCLTSHPLLTDEVAYTFWIGVGLVVALSPLPAAPEPFASMPLSSALAAASAAAYAWGGGRPALPSTSMGAPGLSPPETDATGDAYRWTSEYGSLFVPHNATRVYIALRQPFDVPRIGAMGVVVNI